MTGVTGISPKITAVGPVLPGGGGKRIVADAAVPVDGVVISDQAMAAVEAARFAVLTPGEIDIRSELVAKARENIEQGVYRIQKVVIEVAKHLIPALTH